MKERNLIPFLLPQEKILGLFIFFSFLRVFNTHYPHEVNEKSTIMCYTSFRSSCKDVLSEFNNSLEAILDHFNSYYES